MYHRSGEKPLDPTTLVGNSTRPVAIGSISSYEGVAWLRAPAWLRPDLFADIACGPLSRFTPGRTPDMSREDASKILL